MTYEEFAHEYGITMTCKQIPKRQGGETWPAGSTHWRCHLKRGPKKMQITYSMGSAHKGLPDLKDVLYSVGSDASIYESAGSYEDFLNEFGYEDEKQHRQTWLALTNQTRALRRFFDDDALYNELLYETTEEEV